MLDKAHWFYFRFSKRDSALSLLKTFPKKRTVYSKRSIGDLNPAEHKTHIRLLIEAAYGNIQSNKKVT